MLACGVPRYVCFKALKRKIIEKMEKILNTAVSKKQNR